MITDIGNRGVNSRFLFFESCMITDIGIGNAILFFLFGLEFEKKICVMRIYFLMKFDKLDKNKSRWRFEIDFWIFEK